MEGLCAVWRSIIRNIYQGAIEPLRFHSLTLLLILSASCGNERVVFEAAGLTDPLDTGASSSAPNTVPSPGTVQQCQSYTPTFSRRVWRLTGPQYINAVKAAFPGVTTVGNPFANNYASGPYNNNANGLHIGKTLTENLITESEKVSSAAATSLRQTYTCLNSSLTEACVASVVQGLGLRLFRRPLTAKEGVYYGNFLKTSIQNFVNDGVAVFAQAMLMSPNFLFRYEVGDPVTGLLDNYEKASLISFSAANTSPDSELLEAAKNNELGTAQQIKNQFVRMARKSGDHESVLDFFKQYLHYDLVAAQLKDSILFPDFSPEIGKALVKETDALIVNLLNTGAGTFQELFSTSTVMASPLTAHIYGVSSSGKTSMFQTVDNKRAGLLSQPSFLASVGTPTRTSPVLLGKLIRFSLLCTKVPEPPPDIPSIEESPATVYLTQRAQLAAHSKASCAQCHQFMDPLGFGFEGFDATGKLRTHEGGMPVDDTGAITFTKSAIDGPYKGNKEIADRLSDSEVVQACFLKNSYLYLAGQADETNADCFVKKVQAAGAQGGGLLDNFGILFGEFLMARRVGTLGALDNTPAPAPVPIVVTSSSSSSSSTSSAPTVLYPSPPMITARPAASPPLSNTTNLITISWSGGTGLYLTRWSINGGPATLIDDDTRTTATFPVTKGNSYRFWIHSRRSDFSYGDATSFGTANSVEFSVAP